ncbi:hypothetical protein Emed_003036 [Eimeria media]
MLLLLLLLLLVILLLMLLLPLLLLLSVLLLLLPLVLHLKTVLCGADLRTRCEASQRIEREKQPHPAAAAVRSSSSNNNAQQQQQRKEVGETRDFQLLLERGTRMLQPRFSISLLRRLCLSSSSSRSSSSSSSSRCSSSSSRVLIALQQRRFLSAEKPSSASGNSVSLTFVEADGAKKTISVQEGVTLLEAAHANDVPVEGACDGQCACSTCHVILSERLYESLPEPSVEEDDMLDLAACLTDT